MIFDKGQKPNGGKIAFQQMVLDKTTTKTLNNNKNLSLIPYTKINSKWIVDLSD